MSADIHPFHPDDNPEEDAPPVDLHGERSVYLDAYLAPFREWLERDTVTEILVNGPGEARETDIGITGGGNGKHMVYLSGVTDHHVKSDDMLDHIVRLVETKAAQIEAGEAVAFDPHAKEAAE